MTATLPVPATPCCIRTVKVTTGRKGETWAERKSDKLNRYNLGGHKDERGTDVGFY